MINDNVTSFRSHSIKIMRIVGLFFAIQFFPTVAFHSIYMLGSTYGFGQSVGFAVHVQASDPRSGQQIR